MPDDADARLNAAGERYRAARDEWKAARHEVAAAVKAMRRADPDIAVSKLAARSGLERQAVYEVLGQKVRGGGRSRPRATRADDLAVEAHEDAP